MTDGSPPSPEQPRVDRPVIAVCGKGGVGKTVVSALLGRVLLAAGARPRLLVDADPVCGLVSAIGERAVRTIGAVRQQVIASARGADDAERAKLADEVDYLVFEALAERDGYALLAMGRKLEKGCFCPVNSLLRSAIDLIIEPFAAVVIDAEAGVEQINREVTRRMSHLIVVTDGSRRSADTLALITEMVDPTPVSAVINRARAGAAEALDSAVPVAGIVPEDDTLRQFDREGRSLWELPAASPALVAVAALAQALGVVPPSTEEPSIRG